MIIQRRYLPLSYLFAKDIYAKEVIEKAYSNFQASQKEKERLWRNVSEYQISLSNADLGSGIPNIGYIAEEFERLDQTHPYDNGYTFEDVNKVEVMYRSEDEITLELINRYHGAETTIGVITIKQENLPLLYRNS